MGTGKPFCVLFFWIVLPAVGILALLWWQPWANQEEAAQWWPVTSTGFTNFDGIMEVDVVTDAPFREETKVVARVTLKGPTAAVLYDSTAVYKPFEKGTGQLDLFGVDLAGRWLNPADKQVGPDDINALWQAIEKVKIRKRMHNKEGKP